MQKTRVIMLVMMEFFSDPRVFRSAKTISSVGYDTYVISYVPKTSNILNEKYENILIKRIIGIGHLEEMIFYFLNPFKRSLFRDKNQKTQNLSDDPNADQQTIEKIFQSLYSIGWFSSLLYKNFKLFFKCLKLKSQIVHANDLDTLLAGYFLSKRWKSSLIYDAHEIYNEQLSYTPRLKKKLLFLLERILIKHADAVITINESIADVMSTRYSIPRPEIIPNCPYYQSFENATLQAAKPRIIYQGIFGPEKGLEQMIMGATNVLEGKFFFRGYGDLEGELREKVREEKLEEKIIFLPPVEMKELVSALHGFDIGIIPYMPVSLNHKYATGNKIFEYMMAGLAIAASDIPEIRKIVDRCENGILFDPSNPMDISNKINEIIRNKDRLDLMKRNSLRCAKEYYNWEVQGLRLVLIYKKISRKIVN